jgi:hypothetical protein
MQEQSQVTGTWRIGFDLAAFVLLATVSGMAAAVTLASIALLLGSVVPGTPPAMSGVPITAPGAPAAVPGAPPASPEMPATMPGPEGDQPGAPAANPAAPATAPVAPEGPAQPPTILTWRARVATPVHCTAAASAGRGASFLPGRPPRSPASAQKFA